MLDNILRDILGNILRDILGNFCPTYWGIWVSTFLFAAQNLRRTTVDEKVVIYSVPWSQLISSAGKIPRRIATILVTVADSCLTRRVITSLGWRRSTRWKLSVRWWRPPLPAT